MDLATVVITGMDLRVQQSVGFPRDSVVFSAIATFFTCQTIQPCYARQDFSAIGFLSGTKLASQNPSDHGGREQARNHSDADIAGFCASPAAKYRNRLQFWG